LIIFLTFQAKESIDGEESILLLIKESILLMIKELILFN